MLFHTADHLTSKLSPVGQEHRTGLTELRKNHRFPEDFDFFHNMLWANPRENWMFCKRLAMRGADFSGNLRLFPPSFCHDDLGAKHCAARRRAHRSATNDLLFAHVVVTP
jgi:hypothetical protein